MEGRGGVLHCRGKSLSRHQPSCCWLLPLMIGLYCVVLQVVPKLFPIPFFREYVSVMRSFGLEDTEDQDLEIPTMGADNKQTLTHFQLTL
mmetsp:Transcript_17654/g.28751  ORF Transcript_17654/g.28751 Transcript_17654/m.28751 type:complete len:90 (+) Transcript_17654:1365-1634(+)